MPTLTGTVALNITLTGQTASGTTSLSATTTSDFMGDEQQIAITATAINLGDISGIKALYVRNLDATNFVQIDSSNTFVGFPQKLMPGDAILLLPQTTTIYAKADTAPVKIWIVAG